MVYEPISSWTSRFHDNIFHFVSIFKADQYCHLKGPRNPKTVIEFELLQSHIVLKDLNTIVDGQQTLKEFAKIFFFALGLCKWIFRLAYCHKKNSFQWILNRTFIWIFRSQPSFFCSLPWNFLFSLNLQSLSFCVISWSDFNIQDRCSLYLIKPLDLAFFARDGKSDFLTAKSNFENPIMHPLETFKDYEFNDISFHCLIIERKRRSIFLYFWRLLNSKRSGWDGLEIRDDTNSMSSCL